MSWAIHHTQSEQYANRAEEAARLHDFNRAGELYKLAAEQETLALGELDRSKKKTLGITLVSAASLWYKAQDFRQAERIAYQGLSDESLPSFAVKQLQSLLQTLWSEEARRRAGVDFTEGEVLVSVSGGQVVIGGAPLELILTKVDEVGRMFYRTIELLLNRPFRKRGAPSPDIQEQFRPWLFQAAPGSYQFAVRVERPKQLTLFPEAAPYVDEITQKFLQIVRASVDDPQGELVNLVPNQEYRDVFLKLTRNLAPTGKVFGQLEIQSPTLVGQRPVVLMPASREVINKALRKPESEEIQKQGEELIKLRGILRGLQLDNDWIEIHETAGEQRLIRISETGDVIDDVIGPMVNRPVIVDVVKKSSTRYAYRDIQLDE
jgi:hypothetical protein